MRPIYHRERPRGVCEDSFYGEAPVRRARVRGNAPGGPALLRVMSNLNMVLIGCLLRISSLFLALREVGDAFRRVVWEFGAQDKMYERRVGAPGVGPARAPFPAPKRCLRRAAIYDVILKICTATHDRVDHVTGFLMALFGAFINVIRPHLAPYLVAEATASLPRRRLRGVASPVSSPPSLCTDAGLRRLRGRAGR